MERLDKHFTDLNKNHLHVQNQPKSLSIQSLANGFFETNVDISNAWLDLSTSEWLSVQL